MGWSDRVVMVVGVGSGLGSALVSLLGESGASVVGVARNRLSLANLEKAADARRWRFLPLAADARSQAEMDAAVRTAVERFGHLDGVSLNVGHWIGGETLLHRTTDTQWTEGLVDNLDPILRVGRAVLPHFLERKQGVLVLVSAAERVGLVGAASYCLAKGGMLSLTKKLATDYRSQGIRVNAVLPGNMSKEVDPLKPPPSQNRPRLWDRIPTSSWEVARAIQYLLSDEAAWVTGALLTVDGGFSIHAGEEPSS